MNSNLWLCCVVFVVLLTRANCCALSRATQLSIYLFAFNNRMATTLEASYQPLQPYGPELGEPEETPQDSGVMIHVVPESSRGKNPPVLGHSVEADCLLSFAT